MQLGGESQVAAMSEAFERLADARPGFVMPAGAGIGVGGEAEMPGFEPAGRQRVHLAQARLDLVEARRRALLRQGPAEMDQRKACQRAIELSSARRSASRAALSTSSGRRSHMFRMLTP